MFHPKENLLLTSGLDRKVKIFEVSHKGGVAENLEDAGQRNNLDSSDKAKQIQSIFVPDLPVKKAAFIQGGDQVILTGNRKHYYIYDLGSNKLERQTVGTLNQKNLENLVTSSSQYFCVASSETGQAHVHSQASKKLLFSLKMNGSCHAVAFHPTDERFLFTAGDQAEIYKWDIRQRRCIAKVADEGGFQTTALDISADGKHLSSGSKMGGVNIFNLEDGFSEESKPEKTIMNLTTSITSLKFNPTGQLLSFSSKWKKNAVRMVHIPSYTVY
mmetsp:Transcript_4977/g.7454  ORF Transcript_4977/g.7454 Transcript_4977/m.7454 type:complete len:272 (-) Transcript_4977:153-968(-)